MVLFRFMGTPIRNVCVILVRVVVALRVPTLGTDPGPGWRPICYADALVGLNACFFLGLVLLVWSFFLFIMPREATTQTPYSHTTQLHFLRVNSALTA